MTDRTYARTQSVLTKEYQNVLRRPRKGSWFLFSLLRLQWQFLIISTRLFFKVLFWVIKASTTSVLWVAKSLLFSLHWTHSSDTGGGFFGVASGLNDIFLAAALRRADGGTLGGGTYGVAWSGAGTMSGGKLVIGVRGDIACWQLGESGSRGDGVWKGLAGGNNPRRFGLHAVGLAPAELVNLGPCSLTGEEGVRLSEFNWGVSWVDSIGGSSWGARPAVFPMTICSWFLFRLAACWTGKFSFSGVIPKRIYKVNK